SHHDGRDLVDAERFGQRRCVLDEVLRQADAVVQRRQLLEQGLDLRAQRTLDAPGDDHVGRLLREEVDADAAGDLGGQALFQQLLVAQRDHGRGPGGWLPSFCQVAKSRWKAVNTVITAINHNTGASMPSTRPAASTMIRTPRVKMPSYNCTPSTSARAR